MPFQVQLVDVNGNLVNLDHAVSVPFHTVDGTGATGAVSTGTGADFLARTGTVVIPANQKIRDASASRSSGTRMWVATRPSASSSALRRSGHLFNPAANAAITVDHSMAIGTIVSDDTTTPPTVTVVALSPGVEADAANGIAGSPATFQVSFLQPHPSSR